MLYHLETPVGRVSLSKHVIGRLVVESVQQFGGRVLLSNHKGKVPGGGNKKSGDEVGLMEITMGPNGLDLRIFVVIHFGTSIGAVTSKLIEDIHTQVKEHTTLAPNSVAIAVTGMISKQQMAKRNIEVKG